MKNLNLFLQALMRYGVNRTNSENELYLMDQLINFADLKQSVTPDSPALILNVKGVRDVNRRELLGAVL